MKEKGLFALSLLLFTSAATAAELPAGYTAVEYIDEDGCLQTNETATVVTADTKTLETGWYVVMGEVSRIGGIDVAANCTANLILADGAKLTVEGLNLGAGINVSPGETLNIYGQPFTVGEGSVTVTIKAIPGLKYALKRTDSLRPVEDNGPHREWGEVGNPVVATGVTVTLEDADPPTDKAFYTIVVSMP